MLLEFRLPPKGDTTPDPLAIGGRRVRGFLCGTTNPLLSQNTRLAEAIVHTLPFPSTEASKVSGGGDLAPQVEGQNLEASGDLEIESTDPGQRVGFPSDSHSSNRTGGVLSRLLVSRAGPLCPLIDLIDYDPFSLSGFCAHFYSTFVFSDAYSLSL